MRARALARWLPIAFMVAVGAAAGGAAPPVVFARTLTAPIFDHVLAASLPKGFAALPAYEATLSGPRYVREHVLEGESDSAWTQMITVTGFGDLSAIGEASPERFVDAIAAGFRNSCPDSFAMAKVPAEKVGGLDSYGAVVSCGVAAATAGRTSETALIVAIRGARDFYTLRWTRRDAPSAAPLAVDLPYWSARLAELAPVRICPIVAGERAPYPSCTGR
jgi:hypothetical protein